MKNFRTKVFKQAHELMRATGKAFAVCLSKAWALYRLTKRMRREIVTFRLRESGWKLEKGERNVTGRSEPHQRYRSGKLQDRPLLRR